MTELFLVRHGETDWNRARRIQGRTDIPLNDTGRAQAKATGQLLSRRSWDGVFASPLSRATETGAIIAAGLGLAAPAPVPGVVERDYGEAEGLPWEEIEQRFPDGAEVPGRETREQVAERVVAALCELAAAHPGERLIVVSHGGAIRSVLQHAEPDTQHPAITNGSVHSFRVTDDGLELIAFDDPIEAESLGTGGDIEEQNALEHRPS
ncbi:phosphatase PhoE [Schumannella luteola]|uniref:Broad specificity phosphatase PhoE n=1 Tax=Schumannella luteola TaxID=472059 RepID=A0A852YF80_9MICO|nr:histidine phosphatase family protein [Schumannella luteola]NYG99954.1 broad specificity phosphatase PhoE [Schumannella luteola]TPX05502.1 histidine phosphatase family protein [Schumannella luteola]